MDKFPDTFEGATERFYMTGVLPLDIYLRLALLSHAQSRFMMHYLATTNTVDDFELPNPHAPGFLFFELLCAPSEYHPVLLQVATLMCARVYIHIGEMSEARIPHELWIAETCETQRLTGVVGIEDEAWAEWDRWLKKTLRYVVH